MKKNIREFDLISLTSEYNQPKFRAKQLYRWLWKKSISWIRYMEGRHKNQEKEVVNKIDESKLS